MLETRVLIALALIAIALVMSAIWGTNFVRRRHRQRLRRRGIKTYGH